MCANYGPISLTYRYISKILDKCIKFRLYEFIEKSCIFSERQFEFRNNKGASKASQSLLSYIHIKLDEGDFLLEIFLDVEKAFHLVEHNLLLKKLDTYGIRGVTNNLINCFITNRNQRVKINNVPT